MVHGGPQLHYSNRIGPDIEYFLKRGIDAVSVNYGGFSGYGNFLASRTQYAAADVVSVIDYVAEKGFTNICLFGDSYGTKVALEALVLTNQPIHSVFLTSIVGNPIGRAKSQPRFLVFQREFDPIVSPIQAKASLSKYWSLNDDRINADNFITLTNEGHSFRLLSSWEKILPKVANAILEK